jgi:hypothetical protein
MEQVTAWIATHTPAYYGPALAAWVVAYRFTGDFSFQWARNLLRGALFALLIGSKFVVTPEGVSPVPLWQHALTGSAGFALVALVFWTIGGYGLCMLLDAILETLKAATKALKNSVVTAAILMAFGAIGALATAPLGRLVDERFAPPPIDIPESALPAVIDAIAPAPQTVAADEALVPSTAPMVSAPAAGTPSTAPAPVPATAPATAPTTVPAPTSIPPAAAPATQPQG